MTDPQRLGSPHDKNLEVCLARLAAGEIAARDDLIAIACDRMRGFAHRMLRIFPSVRRWDQTDDVMQNASIRLYRALAEVTPRDAREFLGLMAVQIRRELLDLARKHAGPESYANNHETNFVRRDGKDAAKIAGAQDLSDSADRLQRWTQLHEAAASLPDEVREVFHLAWYMGLKQEEIAQMLGCSTKTVKRRWESAKTNLATSLAGERPD